MSRPTTAENPVVNCESLTEGKAERGVASHPEQSAKTRGVSDGGSGRSVETGSTDNQPSGTTKAKDYLSILVTALPLIGAIGTVFVWVFSAVYVGNVELTTSKPYRSIFVQVFNEKGNQTEFHSPRFQLMPGDYVLQVFLDNQIPTKCAVIVKFHEKVVVPLQEPVQAATDVNGKSDIQEGSDRPRKRWWQFWRK
jgi:hypothetical protein